jgi:UDP-N-acetylglucosamine diphosphorylase/glucosamine-1-phosphate N-acetyltransferase
MPTTICIFEDAGYRRLLPLTYFRPVYDLRCGITALREKIARSYPGAAFVLHARTALRPIINRSSPGAEAAPRGGYLFLNGRILAPGSLSTLVPASGDDALFVDGDTLIGARLGETALRRLPEALPDTIEAGLFGNLPKIQVSVPVIRYPWDLVHENGAQIAADFQYLSLQVGGTEKGAVDPGVHLLNPGQIFIGPGARVKPGVVLDAEDGPILISRGAKVLPNAMIEGPAFVGERSLIKAGAKIYGSTSIGEVCKVGGEVEGSIVHSYSNKQHDGFLGHSYLGMWVNLGADTNNSDLKNNYSTVRVTIDGTEVDSGSHFVGLTMGDHSKSGINTMFNTGTVVGVSSNVFGAGFPPKSIPSFSWGGADGLETYDLERALGVARRVMARRNVVMSPDEEALFRAVFAETRRERD